MANPEHLIILDRGVYDWNKWRQENPGIRPDLSGVNLQKADLFGANFKNVDFSGANLWKAGMSDVNLSGSDLLKVNLSGADLQRANLCGSDMVIADLREANMRKANLERVDLFRANLWRTDLREVNLERSSLYEAHLVESNLDEAKLFYSAFGYTTLSNIDLSSSYGLESITHYGPSFIDVHTLSKSQGKIPKLFLRGCGVSDKMIEYAVSLTTVPVQYCCYFICHNKTDAEFAVKLYNDLQDESIRCWLDQHDVEFRYEITSIIDASIRIKEKIILILSKASLESEWLKSELDHAIKNKVASGREELYLVWIDDAFMGKHYSRFRSIINKYNIVDFSQWKDANIYKNAFDILLKYMQYGA